MSRLMLGLVAAFATGTLHAQSERPLAPTLPLVQAMPAMVHLEISIEELPESPTTPPAESSDRIKSIELVRTGNSRKLTLDMQRGPSVPVWILDDLIFTRGANGSTIFAENYNVTLPGYFQAGNTFYGVDWVTLEYYKGIETLNGRACYYFEGAALNGPGGAPVSDQLPSGVPEKVSKAWIDVETKLPLAAVLPEGKCSYRFLTPPTAPLVAPEDYAKRYAKLIAEARRRQQESSVR